MKTQEEYIEELKSHRESLKKNRDSALEQTDKLILALTSGALTVSFAFLDGIVDLKVATNVGLIEWAWILWTTSLIVSLAAFILSYHIFRIDAKRIGLKIDNNGKDTEKTKKMKATKDYLSCWTRLGNWISIFSFVIGLVFFIGFININIYGA